MTPSSSTRSSTRTTSRRRTEEPRAVQPARRDALRAVLVVRTAHPAGVHARRRTLHVGTRSRPDRPRAVRREPDRRRDLPRRPAVGTPRRTAGRRSGSARSCATATRGAWRSTARSRRGRPTRSDRIDRLVDEVGVVGLKLYPLDIVDGKPMSYRMDDPEACFPLLERAQQKGIKSVGVHKALPLGPMPMDPFRIDDVEGALGRVPRPEHRDRARRHGVPRGDGHADRPVPERADQPRGRERLPPEHADEVRRGARHVPVVRRRGPHHLGDRLHGVPPEAARREVLELRVPRDAGRGLRRPAAHQGDQEEDPGRERRADPRPRPEADAGRRRRRRVLRPGSRRPAVERRPVAPPQRCSGAAEGPAWARIRRSRSRSAALDSVRDPCSEVAGVPAGLLEMGLVRSLEIERGPGRRDGTGHDRRDRADLSHGARARGRRARAPRGAFPGSPVSRSRWATTTGCRPT